MSTTRITIVLLLLAVSQFTRAAQTNITINITINSDGSIWSDAGNGFVATGPTNSVKIASDGSPTLPFYGGIRSLLWLEQDTNDPFTIILSNKDNTNAWANIFHDNGYSLYLDSENGDSAFSLININANTGISMFSETPGALVVDISGNLSSDMLSGRKGISSLATDAAVAVSATGWTNSFAKAATAWIEGTNVTYIIANSAGTLVRTNILAAGTTLPVPLQSGGKLVVTSGTITGSATPW